MEILSDLDGVFVWWPRGDKMGFYGVATWRYYKRSGWGLYGVAS